MSEAAGGLGVHVHEFGTEFAEEHGRADAAGAVDGIEDDAETLVGDAADVEDGEDGLDVMGVGARVFGKACRGLRCRREALLVGRPLP